MCCLSVLLILSAIFCVQCIQLDQPEVLIVKPGETFSIPCKITGYSASGGGYTNWMRHSSGKAMEWIGWFHRSTSNGVTDSLKNKISFSAESSSNTVFLTGKNFNTDDTAVYYCARSGRDAFDYWGKGTQVTVTSIEFKPPVVFTMPACSSSDSGMLGCLATGFFPGTDLSFKWTDKSGKALTNFVQYPTLTTGEKSLILSHITVLKDTDHASVKCEAVHSFKKAPTVSLVPVTTHKSTFVMCVIEDFYPNNLTVQWKVNNTKMPQQTKLDYTLNEETGLYTAQDLYRVSSDTWNKHTDYTCEVTHMGQIKSEMKNFKATFALTLKSPIQRDLVVFNRVILQAVVSGNERKSVEDALVSCSVEKEVVKNIEAGDVQRSTINSQLMRIHNVTVDTKKWFEGKMVTCNISNKNIKQEIHFNKGDAKTPKVAVYQNSDNNDSTRVSLVCEVSSPKLGDVYIMWRVDNEKYIEGQTTAPIHREDSTSVLSIIDVSKEEYKESIACAVKHANMNDTQSPTIRTTSQSEPPEPETGFALNCNEDVIEEDEFRSLWSTATSFIFLFLFSLTYGALLSLSKMKQ